MTRSSVSTASGTGSTPEARAVDKAATALQDKLTQSAVPDPTPATDPATLITGPTVHKG